MEIETLEELQRFEGSESFIGYLYDSTGRGKGLDFICNLYEAPDLAEIAKKFGAGNYTCKYSWVNDNGEQCHKSTSFIISERAVGVSKDASKKSLDAVQISEMITKGIAVAMNQLPTKSPMDPLAMKIIESFLSNKNGNDNFMADINKQITEQTLESAILARDKIMDIDTQRPTQNEQIDMFEEDEQTVLEQVTNLFEQFKPYLGLLPMFLKSPEMQEEVGKTLQKDYSEALNNPDVVDGVLEKVKDAKGVEVSKQMQEFIKKNQSVVE